MMLDYKNLYTNIILLKYKNYYNKGIITSYEICDQLIQKHINIKIDICRSGSDKFYL